VLDLSKLSDAELYAYAARVQAMHDPASLAKWINPAYQIRDHHRLIGDKLAAFRNPNAKRKLMVLAPPRSGKSELVTKMLPLWWLMHHPGHQVVAASYGSELAKIWGRDVRRLVREHGDQLGLTMSAEVRTAQYWKITTGGGMRTVGVGAGLTGHDADLLICDDPHKDREEAESKILRDRVDDWWSSTFITRGSPGTCIVLVLTRWHEDDIAGRLLAREGDAWEVVRLPAICDDPANDQLGRALGEPLGHPKIDDPSVLLEHWNSLRTTMSKRDWFALFQCDPQPIEGALLTLEQVEACRHRPGDPLPDKVKVAIAVDPSGTARGDEAGIVAGFLGADNRCYITHDATRQASPTEWAREVALIAHEEAADVIYVETNFGGEMCALQIKAAWSDLEEDGTIPPDMLLPRIEEVRAKYGKRIRAEPVAQYWVQGDIRLVGDHDALIKQWTTWQTGSRESPGRIDATVYLAQGLLKNRHIGPARIWTPPVGESIYAEPTDWETFDLY
jgi:hypothetical protein